MKPMSLFPDDGEQKPLPHPGPPVVWLRRLMLVRERRVGAEVIRDIGFRQGLNIINTPESPTGETRTVGHNVGKTLLIRIIRYCLGDRNFANRAVRLHFQAKFADAYVLAEVIVAGTCWVIARPFSRSNPSWAISGGVCADVLGDSSTFRSYDVFMQALSEATAAQLRSVVLPHIARAPEWTDLLGWLARDQHCRFRHHNEWREPDMESGPPTLKIEDANLITRVVMGVLDPKEQELAARLDDLRQKRKQAEEKCNVLEQSFKYTRAHLMRRLGLTSEAPIGRLFATAVRESLNKLRDQLQSEREQVVSTTDMEQFEAARLRAERDVGAAEGKADQMLAQKELVEARLGQAETNKRTAVQLSLGQLLKCEHPECPLGKADRPPGTSDPLIVARIAELRDELRQIESDCEAQNRHLEELKQAERDAAVRLRRQREQYNAALAKIQSKDGEYRVLGEQVTEYESDIDKHDAETKKWERLGKSIDTAQDERSGLLERHESRFNQLQKCYRQVLQQLLPDANGKLALNNKVGLAPQTDDTMGEAIDTAVKVVGFDLACLLAGIAGLGHHPRFLIHDSPREADLERTAYNRLFEWAFNLEKAFSDPPPFQYILTTTTPPPPALAISPFVCLTLDAREEGGLLLKEKF